MKQFTYYEYNTHELTKQDGWHSFPLLGYGECMLSQFINFTSKIEFTEHAKVPLAKVASLFCSFLCLPVLKQ